VLSVAVTKTMNALYGATSEQQAALSWSEALLALSIRFSASIIAAWWPARMAARTPPAHMLGDTRRRLKAARSGGGMDRLGDDAGGLGSGATAGAAVGERYTAAAGGLCGGVAVAGGRWIGGGGVLRGMGRMGRMSGAVAVQRVALSHLRRPTVRHRFAVAALASAVAMTTGMAVMVASFDHTMRGWIDRTMKADIYVSSAGAQSASSTHFISCENGRVTPWQGAGSSGAGLCAGHGRCCGAAVRC
jgi:putative ABC transport system permease protein